MLAVFIFVERDKILTNNSRRCNLFAVLSIFIDLVFGKIN
jgi:hypothetical protein